MFLFIGESLGMQELIFIGVFALMIFGPRKLPQLARTFGKIMAEFRRTTNEFKETWQKEVDFEEFKDPEEVKAISPVQNSNIEENSIQKNGDEFQNQIIAPEIKELEESEFEKGFSIEKPENINQKQIREPQTSKQNWL